MLKKLLLPALAVVVLACIFTDSAFAASANYTKLSPGSIAITNNPAGQTRDSNALSISVPTSVPANAIVTKITVKNGTVTNGPGLALNVISSYNIKAPTMSAPVSVSWKNATTETYWASNNCALGSPSAQGTWLLSMTGKNITNTAATTSHVINSIVFDYTY